jgi:aryl-alcohol dehydrogenase-like predicted oxidoreductase
MKNDFSTQLSHKLGFGTWQFGGANFVNGKPTGWGDFDEKQAIQTIHYGLEQGIRFFDTADSYGRGQAETILGKALQQKTTDGVIICTKFGNKELEKDIFTQDFSANYIENCVNKSLKRLQTDYLDVLLLHSPPDDFDWKNYDNQALEQLVKKGLIGQYGVSSKSVYGAKKVIESGFGSVVEVIYNVLDRRAKEVLFSLPNFNNYSIIGRVPMASGFLSSKYLHQEPVFRSDEYRNFMVDRDRHWFIEQVRNLGFLEEEAENISEAALRFALFEENIAVVIPGMRNILQVENNLSALKSGKLSAELLNKIIETTPDVPEWWKPKIA